MFLHCYAYQYYYNPVGTREIPTNERVLTYRKGNVEEISLRKSLEKFKATPSNVLIRVGNEEINSENVQEQNMPFDHSKSVAHVHFATKEVIHKGITDCLRGRVEWEQTPMNERANIFFKAAELAAHTYRGDLVASIMLGQGKILKQAEIEARDLIDYFRFNAFFALKAEQKLTNCKLSAVNKTVRGLDGFVAIVAPFHSVAFVGNMISAPILMGNVVLWKPSLSCALSSSIVLQILRQAGLPTGVINFVPCAVELFQSTIIENPNLAGINFAGSHIDFKRLWKLVGKNCDIYRTLPVLVGDCGGKNFHFVHPSANTVYVACKAIEGAFDYQGQNSSSCSLMYVPETLWPEIKDKLLEYYRSIKLGEPDDGAFMSAVIDKQAFDRVTGYIEYACNGSENTKIVVGGESDSSNGYFIQPTIVECTDVRDKIFTDQICGPILCVHIYKNKRWLEVLKSVQSFSQYRLAGSIFARNKTVIDNTTQILRYMVGNIFINDKCSGFVVGQQPFGGSGLSGTNDKAGGPHYLLNWCSSF